MRALVESFLQTGGLPWFFLELLSAALVFSRPLRRRSRFWLRLLGCLLGWGMLAAAPVLAHAPLEQAIAQSRAPILSIGIGCGVLFAASVLTVWGIHAVSVQEALYCGACAYLMEHMAYCARLLGALVLPAGALETGRAGYVLVHAGVYAAAYLLFARKMIRDGSLMATARDSLALTLATLAVVVGMSSAASVYSFEAIHAAYASFACGAVLFGQLQQQKQIKSQSELAVQRQMWSLHKSQYEMSRQSIEIINRKCHDLKHQVAALKHIHDPGRREEVIDSLQSAVMIYDAALETGNEILDTALTEKSLICTRRDIALSCIADGRRLAFMDPVDLYTLVGNALDNAIEAVLPLPPEQRLIRLRVQEKAGLVFLRVENPYAGTLEVRDGLPLTSKEDKQNHGFGMKSIRDVAEKYHGFLDVETEGGLFVLCLSFPLCEQLAAGN